MTTFMLPYDRSDLAALEDGANNPGLTPSERQYGQRLWNGGLSTWRTAPTASDLYACVDIPFDPTGDPIFATKTITNLGNGRWRVCDPNILQVVISGNQVSKAQTVTWLRLIGGKYPSLSYLASLANDVETQAVEPWLG